MDSEPFPDQPPSVAPGWYPTGPNEQRYWDGFMWTEHRAPLHTNTMSAPPGMSYANGGPDTSMAMLSHLLGVFTGFLGPLVIYLVKKDDDQFTRHHAAEALNFQLTVLIGWIATIILFFVIIGFLLLPVIIIAPFVLGIIATVRANRGEWYKYPINIRFVS